MTRPNLIYTYRTRRLPNGRYEASVTKTGPGTGPTVTSFHSGFTTRSAAYRYARSMASAQARAAFASAQSTR